MQEMQAQRENVAYLPGFPLPDNLEITADFSAAMAHVAGNDSLLVIATSVSGLRPTLEACLPFAPQNVIWLCKGFEEATQLLPHQIAREILGRRGGHRCFVRPVVCTGSRAGIALRADDCFDLCRLVSTCCASLARQCDAGVFQR
jgi:glycerol-3-phosphate dehydrogenase